MYYNIFLCHDERLTMGMGRLANTIFLLTIPTASHCVDGVNGEVTGRSSLLFSSSISIVSLPRPSGFVTEIAVVFVVALADAKTRVRTAKDLFSVLIVPSSR